jgi:tetratricopeptide (TPR) repeat protein
MDRLDRISIWAIVILIIGSFALIANHLGEARPDKTVQQQRTAAADTPAASAEVEARVKLARNLLESDSLEKAEALAKELLQSYPYDGRVHMVIGDIFMRRQDPVRAALSYKEAVDLNPDYLDKKTLLFQGKKLKAAVNEALADIDRRLGSQPDDASLKKDRKTLYYLQRRIAGSCS